MGETPLCFTVDQAAAKAQTSRSTLKLAIAEYVATAGLPNPMGSRAVKRGRRTLILAEDSERWVRDLPVVTRATLRRSRPPAAAMSAREVSVWTDTATIFAN